MLPFVKEIDYIEPFQAVLQLSEEPYLCFLDSAKQIPNCGRYSYIAVDPFIIIKNKQEVSTINGQTWYGDPFDLVKEQLQHYQVQSVDDLPPFQGGALGYFGYDLLHHLEAVPKATQDPINAPDMQLGFYDCVIAFDLQSQKAWIISHGFPEIDLAKRQHRAQNRALCLYNKIVSRPVDVAKPAVLLANSVLKQDFLEISVTSNFTREEYCQAVQKTIDYIYAGDIFQANISQCFSGDWPEQTRALDLYAQLRLKNPAPFSAFLNFGELVIVSASPERFIRLQNTIVETRPIKGTRPRGQTVEKDQEFCTELVRSEKDRAENIMIVDLMRNDLSRVCKPNSLIVQELCKLESYETVHHLVSVIKAQLGNNYDAIDLLKATFPGGSVTGAPKIRAMEIIYELEPFSRSVYCGCIGFIGFDGNMDTSIVIRTYLITDKKIYFQAGGGIVADSVPQAEYQESLDKAYILQKILHAKESLK